MFCKYIFVYTVPGSQECKMDRHCKERLSDSSYEWTLLELCRCYRWLIVKDSFVAYIRPSDGTVRDVLLMDKEFAIKMGFRATGIPHGLLISNMSR